MPREPLTRRLYPVLIFLVACLQYVNTVPYDYAWDDKLAITANEYTTRGVKALPEIFTKRVAIPFKSEYRPVPQALHAIEYQIFNGSAHAGHLFNVLWYALACVMVYVFVQFSFPGLNRLYAFLVALLFTVHPLHVEVVANIKSRDEILGLLFGLSGVVLLVKAFEQWRLSTLLGGTLCFAIAFLSKSNAITLLPLAPVVIWCRASEVKLSRRFMVCTGVLGACCVASVVLIRHVQSTVSNDLAMHLNSTVLNNIFLWSAHTETIVPTALVIIGRYAKLFIYPHPLIHLYGYNQIPLNRWTDYLPWLVIAVLLGVVLYVTRTWRLKLPFAFGVVAFAVTYSAYSNLFFLAPDTMADRYMFLPSLGLGILAVYAVYRLAGLDLAAPVITGARGMAVGGLFVVALGSYFVTTVLANRDWRNDSTLIYNRIRYMQNNAAAQAIYGHQLNKDSYEAGSPEVRRERKVAAMQAFARAIQIYPDFQAAWLAIGKLFADQGMYDKAELAFLKAQRLEPLTPDTYLCLGTLYIVKQDTELAIPYLEKAVLLDPKMEEAYVMLGKAYLRSNNLDNLGAMTTTARRWFPANTNVEALEATYFFRKQQYEEAVDLARKVIAKDPQNTLALAVLSSPAAQSFSKK